MATKAANIKALIATDEFDESDFDGLSAKEIQAMRDEFAPETKATNSEPEFTRDEMIEMIVASRPNFTAAMVGKFNESLFQKLFIQAMGTDSGKVESPKVQPPKLPTKPNVEIPTKSDLLNRIQEFLKTAKVQPKGFYPFPVTKAGDQWQPTTVFNVVFECLSDTGFSDASKWAELFLAGHLDVSEFVKVSKYPIRADRMKAAK